MNAPTTPLEPEGVSTALSGASPSRARAKPALAI